MRLFIYDHCPYCVKARMIFGFKHVDVELVCLLNDDEATPIGMVGKKIVPILEYEPGKYMPESMDIVRYVDALGNAPVLTAAPRPDIAQWFEDTRSYLYALAMPRWVQAPLEEFATQGALHYFTHKKEAMIGAFSEQMAASRDYITRANAHLKTLAPLILSPEAAGGEALGEDDIHLFAALRSLSIVSGIHYPDAVDAYRHQIALSSGVPLHDALAR